MSGRHVVLLGAMGAGKTSIGRRVASALGRRLADGDEILEAEQGRTAAELAAEVGVAALHVFEEEIALRCLASDDDLVIAPAASVCESPAVLDALAGHDVVWLTGSIAFLAMKARQKGHRPFIGEDDLEEIIRAQLAVREPLVLALDPLVFDVEVVGKEAAAAAVVAAVHAS